MSERRELSPEVHDVILGRLATTIIERRRSPGWPNRPESAGMLLYEVLEALGFPEQTIEVVIGYSVEEMDEGPPWCDRPAYEVPA